MAKAKKIKWGVIGSGGIARRRTIPEGIVPADNAELAIVYDINAKVNAEVADEFGVFAAGSIEELLASDIDAVYIATPAGLHLTQTLACAVSGKNILCEKPFGITVEDAQKMIAACREANVLLGTGFMMRFGAQHRAALKMIQDGQLGAIIYGRAQLSCWYPPAEDAWRQDPATGGGGSLIDMGSHCIDILEMFFGRASTVSCFISNAIHRYGSEDGAVVLLSFEGGAMATVDTFFCIPDASGKNALELYGSKGSILAKGTIGQADSGRMTAYLNEGGLYDAQQDGSESRGVAILPLPENMYRAEIVEFSQAVIEERQPSNNAELGLRSQKVLAACYRSAETGRVVEVV